jgi:hypothetical protein
LWTRWVPCTGLSDLAMITVRVSTPLPLYMARVPCHLNESMSLFIYCSSSASPHHQCLLYALGNDPHIVALRNASCGGTQ